MARNSDKSFKLSSVWFRVVVFLSVLSTVKMDSSDDEFETKRRRYEERFVRDIEKLPHPLKNPRIRDIKLYLKESCEFMFVRNLKEIGEPTTEAPPLYIHSLLMHKSNIHAYESMVSFPVGSTENVSPPNKINIWESPMENVSKYNILLNYQAIRSSYIDIFIYKNITTPDVIKQIDTCFSYSYILLARIIYCLYNEEVHKSNRNFVSAKKAFIEKIKEERLSIKSLEEIRISMPLIKAIKNEISEEDRTKLEKTMKEKVHFEGTQEYPTKWIRYQYKHFLPNVDELLFSRSFFSVSHWIKNAQITDSSQLNIGNVSFSLLKDMYVLCDAMNQMKEQKDSIRYYNEKWESPVFLSSIIYKTDRCLTITLKLESKNLIIQKIVVFSALNISTVQRAKTMQDIMKIHHITQNKIPISTNQTYVSFFE